MYLFYDFETSSRDLLGQILSYSFILTDNTYSIIQELSGLIKLNRTQLPEIEAILVNRLNIDDLQQLGDTEYDAAKKIYTFLSDIVSQYGSCTLAGYNTNRFDLSFLRNLLIRYGLNPYFSGHLINKDVLHFAQWNAFENPDTFPWVLETREDVSYYSFSLENLSSALGILTKPQTHGARDDVILTLDLVKALEEKFGRSFHHFTPIQTPAQPDSQMTFELGKQKVSVYKSMENPPQKYRYALWLKLFSSGKGLILLDLEKYAYLENRSDAEILTCIRYINPNKHFFILESLTPEESQAWQSSVEAAHSEPFLTTLDAPRYFELIKKDWDIEYQIHEMGFQRIDQLRDLVNAFFKNPNSYFDTVRTLWKNKKDPKDITMIQLYNRLYLNYHPAPDTTHLQRYFEPRYITGSLLKDPDTFESIPDRKAKLATLLAQASEEDLAILEPLNRYYEAFFL